MRVFLITGLSGAGKSIALKTFEDLGCLAVDNMPLSLIPLLLSVEEEDVQDIAIGADIRGRNFSVKQFQALIASLQADTRHDVQVMFFDCDNEVLQRRYTETRRKHPLASDRPVLDGIVHERSILEPLRDIADVIMNTTEWTGADLRRAIRDYLGKGEQALSIFVTSFSFKHGLPRDADMVFDVRFLRNPYYDEALRNATGKDQEVAEYIEQDNDFSSFFSHLTHLLEPLLPRYQKEGKSYLTISIGCTGGRHRSVYVAEKLAGFLEKKEYKVSIRHRDLGKEHTQQV